MFHNLLEYLQSIELGIAHREVSLHRRTCKMAQKGTFLLGAMGTSLYNLYKRCLSNIHKTYSLQSGNVVALAMKYVTKEVSRPIVRE